MHLWLLLKRINISKYAWYNKYIKASDKWVIIMNNKRQNEKEIQDKIRKVNGAMSQEGMPLTWELKQKLYNCITGKSTTEIERKKIIEKYRGI